MKLGLVAAAIIGIVSLFMLSVSAHTPQAEAWSWFKTPTPKPPPTATATPVPGSTSPFAPPECAGMLFSTVYNQPAQDGIFTGTSGADLIIVHAGQIYGRGGNDCLVFTEGAGSQAYGEGGNDVLITRWVDVYDDGYDEPLSGIADGSSGTDRCIGAWAVRLNCEATN